MWMSHLNVILYLLNYFQAILVNVWLPKNPVILTWWITSNYIIFMIIFYPRLKNKQLHMFLHSVQTVPVCAECCGLKTQTELYHQQKGEM